MHPHSYINKKWGCACMDNAVLCEMMAFGGSQEIHRGHQMKSEWVPRNVIIYI
jgi:hypothetical protein